MGYVAGGLVAGVLAIEFSGAIAIVAGLTLLSGLFVAVDLTRRTVGRATPARSEGEAGRGATGTVRS